MFEKIIDSLGVLVGGYRAVGGRCPRGPNLLVAIIKGIMARPSFTIVKASPPDPAIGGRANMPPKNISSWTDESS